MRRRTRAVECECARAPYDTLRAGDDALPPEPAAIEAVAESVNVYGDERLRPARVARHSTGDV